MSGERSDPERAAKIWSSAWQVLTSTIVRTLNRSTKNDIYEAPFINMVQL